MQHAPGWPGFANLTDHTRIELDEDAEAARSGAFVRTWPHKHGCDGFFGAVLDRWC